MNLLVLACASPEPTAGPRTEPARLGQLRQGHAAVLLPDGDVLVAGGWLGGMYSTELLTP